MFSSRLTPSQAFHARKAARIAADARASHTPDGLPSVLRSEAVANEALHETAQRHADKARTIAARGHALYKATARAYVNGTDRSDSDNA